MFCLLFSFGGGGGFFSGLLPQQAQHFFFFLEFSGFDPVPGVPFPLVGDFGAESFLGLGFPFGAGFGLGFPFGAGFGFGFPFGAGFGLGFFFRHDFLVFAAGFDLDLFPEFGFSFFGAEGSLAGSEFCLAGLESDCFSESKSFVLLLFGVVFSGTELSFFGVDSFS